MNRMHSSRFISLSLAFFSLLSLVSAQVAVDFHWYPTAAQPCLYEASNSSHCDPSSVPKYNACVCSNGGGFLDTAASCLGSSDSGDLNTVYSTMSTNYANSNTPISYSLQQWLQHAGSSPSSSSSNSASKTTIVITASQTTPVVSTITLSSASGDSTAAVSVVTITPGQTAVLTLTSSAASSTSGSTSTSSSTAQATSLGASNTGGGGNKLGTGGIVGIALGATAVAAAIACGFLFCFLLRRRNRPGPTSAENVTAPTPGGPFGGQGGEMKEGHTSFIAPQAMPSPDPVKYTYGNQATAGQPMYNQQPSTNYPPQNGYPPHPSYGTQGNYMQPQHGATELQGGHVQAPQEMPSGHY